MKNLLQKIGKQFFLGYHKLQKLPRWIKYLLGILFIVIGAVNIVNPLVNGIILIILGIGLLSENFYEKVKKKHSTKKDISHKDTS